MALVTWLWVVPGVAVLGLFALAEKFITAKRDASAFEVRAASFDRFLTERLLLGKGASGQMGAE